MDLTHGAGEVGLPFADRTEAGRLLVSRLEAYAGRGSQLIVLGLPRGGVPVAFEVAHALRLQLDVYVVSKLGAPGFEELTIGAIATGGITILNKRVIDELGLSQRQLQSVLATETAELLRRENCYRRGQPPLALEGRTAILVDDGLVTAATLRAAIASLRAQGARQVIAAVPVAPPDTCPSWIGRPTRRSAWRPHSRSWPWDSGTRNSRRPRMRRSASCSAATPPR